jgi:hypothetical protein
MKAARYFIRASVGGKKRRAGCNIYVFVNLLILFIIGKLPNAFE